MRRGMDDEERDKRVTREASGMPRTSKGGVREGSEEKTSVGAHSSSHRSLYSCLGL